jgi:hypothetical protein
MPQAWGVALSAADGRVLWRKNLTELAQATIRGWADGTAPFAPFDGPQGNSGTPHPTGNFDGTQLPFLVPAQVSLDHGPNPRGDAWLLGGATTLTGNAAIAYADVVPPQGFSADAGTADGGDADGLIATDVLDPATGALTFDDAYDLTLATRANFSQARSATAQAFFIVNWVHDWLYSLGFDEPNRNAQTDNLNRGGLGGDATLVEALDWQFVEEAAMTVPADGQSPRLQLGNAAGKGPSWLTPDVADGGKMTAAQSNMGPQVFSVSGPLVPMDDGVDAGFDGCEPLLNPAALQGAIALSVSFNRCNVRAVIDQATDAGAVGVVFGSTPFTSGSQSYVLGDPTNVTLPVLAISGQDTRTLFNNAADAGTYPTAHIERPFVPDRPSALDATVITHEYGHLVSGRLVGDSTGLTVKISRAVGEGWSDFLSLLSMVRPGDATTAGNGTPFSGLYTIGGYFAGGQRLDGTGNPSYYLGVRRFPYTTNTAKNGLTFKHINDTTPLPLQPGAAFNANSEVHNTGEVFALMLWDSLVGLLNQTNANFDDVVRRMGIYLLASMKASPANPDMLEARDALLAVVFATSPDDFTVLFNAFKKRGAGPGAIAPPKTSLTNTPVTEDTGAMFRYLFIDQPVLSDEPDWCDHDGTLDSGESGSITVVLRNRGENEITNVTGKVTSSSTGVTLGNGGAYSIPRILPYQTATATVPVALAGVTGIQVLNFTVTATGTGVGNPNVSRSFEFRANADRMNSNTEDFESTFDWNTGWTRGGEIVPFVGFEAFFQQRQSSPIDTQLVLPDPAQYADLWAMTPALKASPTTPVVLTFNQRWSFEVDANGRTFDGSFLEVSTDKQNWTKLSSELSVPYNGTIDAISRNPFAGQTAWVNRSAGYPAWVTTTVNLGTTFAGQNFYDRFHFGSDPGFPATGWEIDDFTATGIENLPLHQVVLDNAVCVPRQPKVNAGADFTVDERTDVTLSGTATDPDGDALTISWRQTSGPPVALDVATFTAPEVTQDTPLEFEMSATDGRYVRQDRVVVTVRDVNRPPDLTAQAPTSAKKGETVTLTATASDPDGDAFTVAWAQDEGPTVTLDGADGLTPTFVAPSVNAKTTLKFTVTASDVRGGTSTAQVAVEVEPAGCGCTSGGGGLALVLLLLRRRRAPSAKRREKSVH